MLTLADAVFAIDSREFNILAALLRGGKVALALSEQALAQVGERAAGPRLGRVLHSQLMFEPLGYVYSKTAILALSWASETEIAHVHANLANMLARVLGAHRVYRPMYPNFPEQVLAASDDELLVNAWMHYVGDWLGMRILPEYVDVYRTPLKMLADRKPALLEPCSGRAYHEHFLRLINGNAALSAANRALVLDLLSYQQQFEPDMLCRALTEHATLAQKETRTLVGGWLLRNAMTTFHDAEFARFFRTPTDVLRLATAVSAAKLAAADLSLSTPQRFGKFSRAIRRLLLALLDAQDADSARAEMFRRREQWVRLGEVLHPGEYQNRYSRAHGHFAALRGNMSPPNWAGLVESAIASGDTALTIYLLRQRPGVFARKLHEVLRKTIGSDGSTEASSSKGIKAQDQIIDAFTAVVDQVSTPVLIQLADRLLANFAGITIRAFSPKAGTGRMWVPRQAAPRIGGDWAFAAGSIVNTALHARFAKLPPMGRVYVDPALALYTVPFGQRTAQKALRTVGRGSRIELGDESILRAFLWWSESGLDSKGERYTIGRTDLDLSCAVLDESGACIEHCSFTRLRASGLTHSGDITSAPDGACEFIDVDFDKLPRNAAYIALLAYAYTQQNFADMPEAYLGWMARAEDQSGEIYDARTVRQKIDLTASGNGVLVGYIDVTRKQFVWADLVLPLYSGAIHAVESSTQMMGVLMRGVVTSLRPSLGALLDMHLHTRGERAPTPEAADIVFTSQFPGQVAPAREGQRVVTAYDAEVLAAEYLA